MKKTNLNEIKKIAIGFLYIPIAKTQIPFLIQHPIFDTNTCYIDGKIIDIFDNENLMKALSFYKNKIENSNSLWKIYLIIRKPYRLTFFKYIHNFLSEKDYAVLLADAWISSENPNYDSNCSIDLLTSWFKKANKEYLMETEDYQHYLQLPEYITVYRGISNKNSLKALSWTENFEVAEWFSNRWQSDGIVKTGSVKKEFVLAYFNTRNEHELIIHPKNITLK